MPLGRITERRVRQLVCPPNQGRYVLVDEQLNFLVLRVRASGHKTFYFRCQHQGRSFDVKLGQSPGLSVKQARQLAKQAYERVCLGLEPLERLEESAGVEGDAADQAEPVMSVTEFYDQHYRPYALLHKRSPANEFSMLENHFLKPLGELPLNEVTPLRLSEWVVDLKSKLSAGSVNVVIFAARAMFNLALTLEIPGIDTNPLVKVKALKVNNGREVFLNAGQVKRLIEAAEQSRQKHLANIIRVLLLTGLRKQELLTMRWSFIDWERSLLTLPENKTGQVRHVPLSAAVIGILRQVEPLPDCPYVFANPRTKKPFQSINHAFIKVRKEAGLSQLTLHDLRHTFASTLVNEGGFLLHEAQQILGHKDIRMTQRYSHLGQPALQRAVTLAAERLMPGLQ